MAGPDKDPGEDHFTYVTWIMADARTRREAILASRQWTIKRKDGKPLIIGVNYDTFDVGRGAEYEFVQVTTPPNDLIAKITDRMLLLLNDDDLDLWRGAIRAPLEDVKALIKTYEFNPDEWDISIEDPNKKPPRPRKPKSKSPNRPEPQGDLF